MNINTYLGIIALIIACLVGFSRIICAVHFVSDVLCGFLIAFIIYLI
ncbi:phosphatase PAP2 family protein [Coprobacillus sp. AM18-4LB-d2]|nr:phosphatase PAP2 family protein [Coprobacillus sp. AM18-4LB-d2]